jgi:enoyl-CoA hydratase/carnithine racemase
MLMALSESLVECDCDPAVRAILLAGAGREHGFARFMDELCAFDKPLLAAVNGVGVGIGLTLLLHCDLVFVAEGARLHAPFVTPALGRSRASPWARCATPSASCSPTAARRSARRARASVERVDPGRSCMPAGQGVGGIDEVLPAAEIVRRVVAEANATIEGMGKLL